MVAAVGGGLCQLSNALYEIALQAGCRIVERHAHSQVVPGSAAAQGRDATVAWNYVDLRFAAKRRLLISARLDGDDLVVRLLGAGEPASQGRQARVAKAAATPEAAGLAPRSCGTCEEVDCHRREADRPAKPASGRLQAFLVDEAWPEFRAYVAAAREDGARLGRPFAGGRFGLGRYDWTIDGFERPTNASVAALRRTLALRSAGRNGSRARRAELASAEDLAKALARLLTPDVTAVTVAQSYLPFLWRDGCLGGREVSVLMTRLPMAEIQTRLDVASVAHPERATLSDFRVPRWLVDAETEALAACFRLVTPHAQVAVLFGDRAVRLPWAGPPA